MALKPIYEHSGNHPVLNYAGTLPVVMESPNPHADWTDTDRTNYNSTLAVASGEVVIHPASGVTSGGFTADVYVYLTYTGAGTINVALSWSGLGTGGYCSASAQVKLSGTWIGTAVTMTSGGTTVRTLAVPYYRYRLYVGLGAGNCSGMTTASYVKVAITFS